MVLDTVEYKQKITSLLEDPSYRRLARDPTDLTGRKTTLLLKKFTLTEDICKKLRPAGSRPPRLYGLPKIHKEGGPSEILCQQHWLSYLPNPQVLSRTAQPTHREFRTQCEKLFPVRPDIGISKSTTRRSND